MKKLDQTHVVNMFSRDEQSINIPVSDDFLAKYPYVSDNLNIKVNTLMNLKHVNVEEDAFKNLSMCIYEDDTFDTSFYNPEANKNFIKNLKIMDKVLNKHQYIYSIDIEIEIDESFKKYIVLKRG